MTVKKIDPKWWLARMHRDKPDRPGWTDPHEPSAAAMRAHAALIDKAGNTIELTLEMVQQIIDAGGGKRRRNGIDDEPDRMRNGGVSTGGMPLYSLISQFSCVSQRERLAFSLASRQHLLYTRRSCAPSTQCIHG